MSTVLSPKLISLDGNILEYFCPGCMLTHNVWTKTPNSLGAIWTWDGNVNLPTFTPSVLVNLAYKVPKVCHSFVRNGFIEYLNDCSHDLAGQTVALPDIPEDWL